MTTRKKKPEEPRILGVLDVVRTPKGTLAVIDAVHLGLYSIVVPHSLTEFRDEKIAWYDRDELRFVGELKDLVKRAGAT